MTLKKFAVDYSKIKNDAPKVRVLARTRILGNGCNNEDTYALVCQVIDTWLYAAANALAQINAEPALGVDTIRLTPKVAALYKVHAAVELVRRIKKDSKAGRSEILKTKKVSWFRDYYEYAGLRIRSNSTNKYYVELHIGAYGWQTWQMLLALGYTPDQDAFWLELDSFISAPRPQSVELENIDNTLFAEVM